MTVREFVNLKIGDCVDLPLRNSTVRCFVRGVKLCEISKCYKAGYASNDRTVLGIYEVDFVDFRGHSYLMYSDCVDKINEMQLVIDANLIIED